MIKNVRIFQEIQNISLAINWILNYNYYNYNFFLQLNTIGYKASPYNNGDSTLVITLGK